MAHFSHFPNEIISEIWGNVLEPESVESFALVSKLVYAVGRPFVEEHNKLKKEYSRFDLNSDTHAGAPVFLLKDVLLRPRLALYVTHLSIYSYWTGWGYPEDNDDSDDDGGAYHHTPYPEDIMALCIEAVGKTSFVPPNQVSRWIEKIRKGDEDPIRALLFLLLPNVTTVTLVGGGNNGDILLETIKRIAKADKPMFLTRLITVNTESEGDRVGDLKCLKAFAALPFVQDLHVTSMGKLASASHIHFTPGSSNITKITFKNSGPDPRFLFGLLESIKGLKAFIYEEPNESMKELGTFCRFEPFWIRAALLANAKHSLESLKILSHEWQAFEEMGTFREFTTLKELETDVRLLMYRTTANYSGFANLLPASIENLYLNARDHDNTKVPILVEEIVRTKLQLIPNLTVLKFRLEPENALLKAPERLMEPLEEKCREVGIELIVIAT